MMSNALVVGSDARVNGSQRQQRARRRQPGVLGSSFATGSSSASATPTVVPGSVAGDAGSADDDACSSLTYGSEG